MKCEEYWQMYLNDVGGEIARVCSSCFHFELTEKLANELLELVLAGKKKATASSLYSFTLTNEKIPEVGDFHIVTDWAGEPRCVIRTTAVAIIPFNQLTFAVVCREGEDDDLESWRKGHTRFFQAEGHELGYVFHEDMPVVFEDFIVVHRR
mgnify:CR=1 FL=1